MPCVLLHQLQRCPAFLGIHLVSCLYQGPWSATLVSWSNCCYSRESTTPLYRFLLSSYIYPDRQGPTFHVALFPKLESLWPMWQVLYLKCVTKCNNRHDLPINFLSKVVRWLFENFPFALFSLIIVISKVGISR